MKASLLLLALLGVADTAYTPPEGDRLRAGQTCYAIVRDGAAVGSTWQAVRADRVDGKPVWDIVVHQRRDDGSFDMRDHFVLDRATLLPIAVDSRRGGDDRSARGWHRVSLRYAGGRVVGRKETAAGSSDIDVRLDGPTWDGNLWGLTFAALPLREGGRYHLPVWQYDGGKGEFTVNVVGRERVTTPAGPVDAWALDAGSDPASLMRYYVSRRHPTELGYRAGPFEQKPGGTCTASAR